MNPCFQVGNTDINPGFCQDNLVIDMGTGKDVKITNDNQNRYRYASFISNAKTVKIIFTSCFQYKSTEGLMYQLQYETTSKNILFNDL